VRCRSGACGGGPAGVPALHGKVGDEVRQVDVRELWLTLLGRRVAEHLRANKALTPARGRQRPAPRAPRPAPRAPRPGSRLGARAEGYREDARAGVENDLRPGPRRERRAGFVLPRGAGGVARERGSGLRV
jgi:hypothetical protein